MKGMPVQNSKSEEYCDVWCCSSGDKSREGFAEVYKKSQRKLVAKRKIASGWQGSKEAV
jgi:hypothetical protein